MPFAIRPYHRVPVVCPVIYEHWFREGEGIVWNLSRWDGDSQVIFR
jgi:hypothetical protein